MAEGFFRRREITNASIRCQNRMHYEAERLEAMAKKTAELEESLKKQGVFERVIKELSGKNEEIRACMKEQETVMLCCMINITEQIARQNWIMGDMLDYLASQMSAGGARDSIQKLANAYHIPPTTVNEPCKAAK